MGNPGRRYQRTRHNVGFRVVETLADRFGATTWRSSFSGRLAELQSPNVILLLPHTYMNDSGSSVAPCAAYFRIAIGDILVVCDDLNLPFGRLRMRRSGTSGGHNGLDSVIAMLGSISFPRLRIGIGRPEGDDAVEHVIGQFERSQEAQLPQVIERAADGAELFVRAGAEAAIARINAFGGGLETSAVNDAAEEEDE